MRTRPLRSRGHAGFTIIEVVITTAILVVGMVSIGLTLVASGTLRSAVEDRSRAQASLHSAVQQIQAVSSVSLDDPAGWSQSMVNRFSAGGALGNTFPVAGLTNANGQPAVATVQVVANETLTDLELGTDIGMPRDLNGDGLAGSNDVSADAQLLPIVVTIQWSGKAGHRQLTQGFFLLGL
jgi:Tfp pilus assembly protein PilV